MIPLDFYMLETGTVHGLAFWFDVAFTGSTQTVWLSTSPTEALTHWYQVRCLLESPLFTKAGQLLTGTVILQANHRYSVFCFLNITMSYALLEDYYFLSFPLKFSFRIPEFPIIYIHIQRTFIKNSSLFDRV